MLHRINAAFGGKVSKEQSLEYAKSPHHHNGRFANITTHILDLSLPDFNEKNPFSKQENNIPPFAIPFQKIEPETLANPSQKTRVTWFGHSTILIESRGKVILIDPMFGNVPSPVSWVGKKRFSKGLPISIEELPPIDVVLMTHDHYDHLDHKSILKIKSKVKQFIVPLGLSAHLLAWGVATEKIKELDWWQTMTYEGFNFRLTTCHHYSGRGLRDHRTTLWGGWIIETEKEKIYLSGDGGYGNHFSEIGKAYGPFDFAMIECGQYSRNWAHNHMFPEQSVQAAIDVQAQRTMPIHWGAFSLAFHAWDDPIKRFVTKAKELNLAITTPQIGEQFYLDNFPSSEWWKI